MEDQTAQNAVKQYKKQVNDSLNIIYRLYKKHESARCFYSVSVSNEESGETAVAEDITADPLKAELVFNLLYRGGVTPCCVFEIVEDIIATMF